MELSHFPEYLEIVFEYPEIVSRIVLEDVKVQVLEVFHKLLGFQRMPAIMLDVLQVTSFNTLKEPGKVLFIISILQHRKGGLNIFSKSQS